MGEKIDLLYKIEIIQLIENRYNIEIKDEDIENIITIQDLIEYIKTLHQHER
jgi:acyl carrier protein